MDSLVRKMTTMTLTDTYAAPAFHGFSKLSMVDYFTVHKNDEFEEEIIC